MPLVFTYIKIQKYFKFSLNFIVLKVNCHIINITNFWASICIDVSIIYNNNRLLKVQSRIVFFIRDKTIPIIRVYMTSKRNSKSFANRFYN